MIPLAALSDPAAFLQGARVPLVDSRPHPMRWEWVGDRLLLRLVSQGAWTEVADAAAMLALDPSDPDVARWCDRRIAEALNAPAGADPVLVIHRKRWHMDMRTCPPHCYPLTVAVEASPANAATARAALVLALFGRTP